LEAVKRNGFKGNGKPWLPLHEAAPLFEVSKTKLTQQFNGRKTKKEAHEHEQHSVLQKKLLLLNGLAKWAITVYPCMLLLLHSMHQ
jgi:hypothetical protein